MCWYPAAADFALHMITATAHHAAPDESSARRAIAQPAPNGSSIWVRVVDEVSGALFEQEITADLPANTQFLSPRLFMNNGATAAAVAYDCAGVYLETDF